MLMTSNMVNAVITKHKITMNAESENIAKIYYQNPCYEIEALMRDPTQYATKYMECNYGYKHSKYIINECQQHYDNNWIKALLDLASCRANQRRKRSVATVITHPTMISAATNFLKSIFVKGENKDIIKNIKNIYNIRNNLNLNIQETLLTLKV